MPTQQEMEKWWNGLQRTLNEADANIDLSKPEDLVRIQITTITDKERDNVANVTAYFPFADEAHKNANVGSLTDEELISMQKPGKPDPAKLEELYTAAKEGRLFFKSLPETRMLSRQLIADKDGNPGVLPDSFHNTPEMLRIALNHDEPSKPILRKVGLGTRLAAFFGSKKAKAACRSADETNAALQRTYEENMEEWRQVQKMDPVLVEQVKNGLYSTANYLEVPDEDALTREERLRDVANKAHKQPLVEALTDMTNEYAKESTKKLSDMMKTSSAVTPEVQELLAEICYQKMLGEHVKKEFEQGTLTVDQIALCTKQAVKGSREYKELFNKTCGTEKFKAGIQKLPPEVVKELANAIVAPVDPVKDQFREAIRQSRESEKAPAASPVDVTDALYKQCTAIVAEEIRKQAAEALKDKPVQTETKDFTAASNRPKLDPVQVK